MRLINRLGFDCAMYDIDAVILKNPQPLYDKHKSDIVAWFQRRTSKTVDEKI